LHLALGSGICVQFKWKLVDSSPPHPRFGVMVNVTHLWAPRFSTSTRFCRFGRCKGLDLRSGRAPCQTQQDLRRRPAWCTINNRNAPHFGNPAGVSHQLFAGRPGVVRSGCGFGTSSLLQARRKASLHDDGDPIGIAGCRSADRKMRSLSLERCRSCYSSCGSAGAFPGSLCWTR
jgi:hypothetical protein